MLTRRCVRYYMNFERAVALMKEVLLSQGFATSANETPGVPGALGAVARVRHFSHSVWLLPSLLHGGLDARAVVSAVPLGSAEKKAAIRDAQTAEELWQVPLQCRGFSSSCSVR